MLRSLALLHRSDHWMQAGVSPWHLSRQFGGRLSCLESEMKAIRGVEELPFKKKLYQL